MRWTLPRWLQPSLVRRLVLAQMATATLLWVALAFYTARHLEMESSASDLHQMRLGASLVLPLTEALDTQPDLLRQTLQRIDDFQRANVAPETAQSVLHLPRLYLWRDGQLIYRSADAQAEFSVDVTGSLTDVAIDGQPWRVYAEDSADKRSRFAALAPASSEAFGLVPWSFGWLVLPLLVSLPLLLLPAWLSVRFALRPWARVAGEIAARGPKDMSPLHYMPVHRELSPLTGAVNQLLARLRLAHERERSFIADAAHELRTPMAAIQVNAEALRGRRLGPADQELLEGLLKSNERACRLVSQLLALTRSEASPDLRVAGDVDMETLVQESLAQWATLANTHRIDLTLESCTPARVYGDPESLRMLVDNIVGNAIKYSPDGAAVRLALSCTDNVVQVDVIDEGPGIDAELRARVFDRFYRIPGQMQAGSGLGLAIAKSIADKHAATLELCDGIGGRGLRVVLRISASNLLKTQSTKAT